MERSENERSICRVDPPKKKRRETKRIYVEIHIILRSNVTVVSSHFLTIGSTKYNTVLNYYNLDATSTNVSYTRINR